MKIEHPALSFDVGRAALPVMLASFIVFVTGPVAHADGSGGSEADRIELTLAQTVDRAVRHNPSLVGNRLYRAVQKYDLEIAEDWFRPQLSFGALRAERSVDNRTQETGYRLAAGPLVRMRLPTGGSISVAPSWVASVTRGGVDAGRRIYDDRAVLGVFLSQPLLRGGGFTAGRAPVRLTRLAEERNVLLFKAVLMDVIVATIRTYRALIQAELRVGIDERSLKRAQETLEVNRLLIDTGRMAERDITQTRADIARRELSLVKSQDALNDARRNLNVLLDLSGEVLVTPTEAIAFDENVVDADEVEVNTALARERNPGYLNATLNVRFAEIECALAENNALWDLSLTASTQYGGSGGSFDAGLRDLTSGRDDGRYTVGLALRVPLGDDAAKAEKRRRLAARIALQRAEFEMENVTRELDTDLRNAVRAVQTSEQEARLAREALALAAKKLEIEHEKLTLGLSSNYRLALIQTDLVDAQVSNVNARIGYLNALTALDRIQGTVLDTWGIDVALAWEPTPE